MIDFMNCILNLPVLICNGNMSLTLSKTLDLFDGDSISVMGIIVAFFVGFVLASLWTIYDKKYLGGFVRKLICSESTTPDSAKTLYELGFDDKLGVRWCLKHGSTFGRWVVCVERDDVQTDGEYFQDSGKIETKKHKPDIDTAKFYIPQEKVDEARAKFSDKGANFIGVLAVVLLLIAAVVVLAIFLPKLISLLQN